MILKSCSCEKCRFFFSQKYLNFENMATFFPIGTSTEDSEAAMVTHSKKSRGSYRDIEASRGFLMVVK